jgi:excisionase family DNA binding protein
MVHSVLVDRAAEILGVSRRTVYYRIREGKLRTIRTRCGSRRVLMESIRRLLRAEAAARDRDVDPLNPAPRKKNPAP